MHGVGPALTRRCGNGSNTAAPVARLTMLVTDDENANAGADGAIDERVREATQEIHAQPIWVGVPRPGLPTSKPATRANSARKVDAKATPACFL